MIVILPVTGNPDSVQTITLGDQAYQFRLRWNTKEECWYCYFGSIGKDFTCKFKIVTGFDLLLPYSGLNGVPSGVLRCFDLDDNSGRVNRDQLIGTESRFSLIYYGE